MPAGGGPWWVGDLLTPAPTAIPMSYPAFLVSVAAIVTCSMAVGIVAVLVVHAWHRRRL